MCPRSLGWVHRCCQDCNMSVDLEFTAKGRGSATHILSCSASKSVFNVQQQQQYVYIYGYIYGKCLKLFSRESHRQAQYSWSFGQTAPGSKQPFSQSSLYLQHLNGWTLGTLMQQWCTKSFYKINCLHHFIEKLRRRRLKKLITAKKYSAFKGSRAWFLITGCASVLNYDQNIKILTILHVCSSPLFSLWLEQLGHHEVHLQQRKTRRSLNIEDSFWVWWHFFNITEFGV